MFQFLLGEVPENHRQKNKKQEKARQEGLQLLQKPMILNTFGTISFSSEQNVCVCVVCLLCVLFEFNSL